MNLARGDLSCFSTETTQYIYLFSGAVNVDSVIKVQNNVP